MHSKRRREDAGDDKNFSAVEKWRVAAELSDS
jgi:alkylhydroperoxidase family enzyme